MSSQMFLSFVLEYTVLPGQTDPADITGIYCDMLQLLQSVL